MNPIRPTEVLARRTLVLRTAFLFIIGGFAACNIVSFLDMSRVQQENQSLLNHMIASIELVSRIARDIDQKRLLIDAHIFEKNAQTMSGIEQKMAMIDRDFATTARNYEPIARSTNEFPTWEKLQRTIAATQPRIDETLVLSRNNLDERARAEMLALESQFNEVASIVNALVQINRDEARQANGQIIIQQRRAGWLLAGITLLGTLVALFVAGWVTSQLKRRDEQLKDAALQLESRNRELDAFAGRVAHDLRGPLTTVNLSAREAGRAAARTRRARSAMLRRGVRADGEPDRRSADAVAHRRRRRRAWCPRPAGGRRMVEEDLRPERRAAAAARCASTSSRRRCSAATGCCARCCGTWARTRSSTGGRTRQLEIKIEGRDRRRNYEFARVGQRHWACRPTRRATRSSRSFAASGCATAGNRPRALDRQAHHRGQRRRGQSRLAGRTRHDLRHPAAAVARKPLVPGSGRITMAHDRPRRGDARADLRLPAGAGRRRRRHRRL